MKNEKIKLFLILLAVISLVILVTVISTRENSSINNNFFDMQKEKIQNIRRPAVANQFYPSDKQELEAMIDKYLELATTSVSRLRQGFGLRPTKSPSADEVGGQAGKAPQVIVVPHAGYVYSGQVAAYGFKELLGGGFKRVIVVGRSHQQFFNGVAADMNDGWQTPLGNIAIDTDFIQELAKAGAVRVNSSPHGNEHSLEVELPFLQRVLGDDFKIVPLLFGDDSEAAIQKLANVLARIIDERTLVVVSSDLSHYPLYEQAKGLDGKTVETILSLDVAKFNNWSGQAETGQMPGVDTLACAKPAIELAILLAQQLGLKPRLLKYANSGDTSPETKNRAVGYAAIAFYDPQGVVKSEKLNTKEQEIALQIARKILEATFDNKEYQPPSNLSEIFAEKRGVFVTLKKHGQLRGCIGNFTPDIALVKNIKQMAMAAAFDDPRFTPLEEVELKNVEIEISVLSPMRKITDPNLIEVGKHGVYVRKGSRGGVYLPQVATEQGWTREQFLDSLCEQKSGIGKDCWHDPSTDLYIFTAQVFHE